MAASTSSLSFFHPHVAYTSSRLNRSNSSVTGKKCEMPFHTPTISVAADMRPRRRRRAGDKKNKVADSNGFEKPLPTERIAADIPKLGKDPIPNESVVTSIANQDAYEQVTHSLLNKPSVEVKDHDHMNNQKVTAAGYARETYSQVYEIDKVSEFQDTLNNGKPPIARTSISIDESDNGKPLILDAYPSRDDFGNGSSVATQGTEDVRAPNEEVSPKSDKPSSTIVNDRFKVEKISTGKPESFTSGKNATESSILPEGVRPVDEENLLPPELSVRKVYEVINDDPSTTLRGKSQVEHSSTGQRKASTSKNLEKRSVSETSRILSSGKDELRQSDLEKQRQQIETLAAKKATDGSKVFCFPEQIKAGTETEIFLNRAASSLAQQPTVKIRGAYNDWRWKSFEADLKKTTLRGDWWSCKLQIPKEAYNIDFVFNNGRDVYENNSHKDFSMHVLDGLNKDAFEDFLIDEERKKMERISAERALEEKRIAEERRLREKKALEAADRVEAIKQAKVERERIGRMMQRAVRRVDGLWYFQPAEFQGGDTVKLFYNRSNRSLSSSNEVWIHGGYNNWQDMVSIVGKLTFHSTDGGDWWTIDVEIPNHAYLINWVMADGPPERATLYDNNGYQDFHALVPKNVPDDLYWAEYEERIFKRLQDERDQHEEAARIKAQRTANMKAEFKIKTMNNVFKSRAHIFYTDPVDVQAGKNVSVFYNPDNTVLNGKPEAWLRVSFNRWTHRLGCLPPVKMLRVEGNNFLKGTIKVPLDAYMMDFVFSERGDEAGGVYDNNHGMDYHVPVVGGFAKEPPMKVVHISVEMAPIAKVGGLGDVVTSLSRAVQELGHSVEIMLPKYDCLKYDHIKDLQLKSDFFWGGAKIKVWTGTVEGLRVHFLEPENGMFWAGCVYGRRDDGNRFGFFCHAALEYLLRSGNHPDIIHCHDWSSAPVAWLFKEHYMQSNLSNARVIFTIHNLEFGTALIGRAMAYADRATTVSETYAREVSANPAIAPHFYKFHGIRNGIDLDIWDPYNDPFIPLSYTSENVVEGKKAAKEELQSKLGLAKIDRPLLGIITRLTAQKGIHLIKHAIWKTLDRGGQVVLLGSAPDPRIQNEFNTLASQLHNSRGDMARLCLHYDEPLSHMIYAGADFILIPSMFEPCGLTQLIAMRYGAIPVVRKTGGLNDTVFDVEHDRDRATYNGLEPNGFSFEGTDAPGLDYALNRALTSFYDARDWFNNLCKQVMEQDWSWNRPALDYMELYYSARK